MVSRTVGTPDGPAAIRMDNLRKAFGGKGAFLFGEFGAVDAFYAPVATRFVTYGVELTGAAREYQEALLDSAGVKAWAAGAAKETDFVAEDEPYATAPR